MFFRRNLKIDAVVVASGGPSGRATPGTPLWWTQLNTSVGTEHPVSGVVGGLTPLRAQEPANAMILLTRKMGLRRRTPRRRRQPASSHRRRRWERSRLRGPKGRFFRQILDMGSRKQKLRCRMQRASIRRWFDPRLWRPRAGQFKASG